MSNNTAPLNKVLWGLLLIYGYATAEESGLQNYYDVESNHPIRTVPIMGTPALLPDARRHFIIAPVESEPTNSMNAATGSVTVFSDSPSKVALPPNMERGVKDLESGIEDLRHYTAIMGSHIHQNGLRGFLAIPNEIRDQGEVVGRKIGNGINGIATDAANDMVIRQ